MRWIITGKIISIHAPARGATSITFDVAPYIHISIHAPARGATLVSFAKSLGSLFQSTLPRGERQNVCSFLYILHNISIHAPARGATNFFICARSHIIDFNPRSREGSDFSALFIIKQIAIISIHAPARGATEKHFSPILIVKYFNPRSREGSDRKYTQTTNIISVYFYLYYIIFVSLATNTAYITITKPSKCRCESPYTFC